MNTLNTDIKSIIGAYLDDNSLDAVMKAYPSYINILDNPLFWHESTELLLGKQLPLMGVNWKDIYEILSYDGKLKEAPLSYIVGFKYSDTFCGWHPGASYKESVGVDALIILFNAQYQPDHYHLIKAIDSYNLVIAEWLIKSGNLDPSTNFNEAIIKAMNYEHADQRLLNFIKMLLKYPSVDVTSRDNQILYYVLTKSSLRSVDMINFLIDDLGIDLLARGDLFILNLISNINDMGVVRLLLKDKRLNPGAQNNTAIISAVNYENLDVIKLLLQDERVDPSAQNNTAIISAVQRGYLDIVKLLLKDKRVDPSAQNNTAIISAVQHENLDVVKLLLKDNRVDPSAQNNASVIGAIRNLEIIELLLKDKRVDPSAQNNKVIIEASLFGYMSVVGFLLKDERVDPSAQNNAAITHAIYNFRLGVIRLLLEDPRVVVEYIPINNSAIIELLTKETVNPLKGYIALISSLVEGLTSNYATKNNLEHLWDLPKKLQQSPYQMLYGRKIKSPGTRNSKDFYYKFLRYLLKRQRPLIYHIRKLQQYILNYKSDSDVGNAVYLAVKSILEFSIDNVLPNPKTENLYYALYGFLMLSYEPRYEYLDILKILRSKGASEKAVIMSASLIGSHFGLHTLLDQGLIISSQTQQNINTALSWDHRLLYGPE